MMYDNETAPAKDASPSAFDGMIDKIGRVEEQTMQASQILAETITLLEGPKPTTANEVGKPEGTAPGIFSRVSQRLDDAERAAEDVLRAARYLSTLIR